MSVELVEYVVFDGVLAGADFLAFGSSSRGYEEWVSEMQCNNAEAFLPCGPSYSSLL